MARIAPAWRLCWQISRLQAEQNAILQQATISRHVGLCRLGWARRRRLQKSWGAGAQPDFTRGAGSHAAMGKVIRTQRKGRGSVFRVSSARWRLGRARGIVQSLPAQSPEFGPRPTGSHALLSPAHVPSAMPLARGWDGDWKGAGESGTHASGVGQARQPARLLSVGLRSSERCAGPTVWKGLGWYRLLMGSDSSVPVCCAPLVVLAGVRARAG